MSLIAPTVQAEATSNLIDLLENTSEEIQLNEYFIPSHPDVNCCLKTSQEPPMENPADEPTDSINPTISTEFPVDRGVNPCSEMAVDRSLQAEEHRTPNPVNLGSPCVTEGSKIENRHVGHPELNCPPLFQASLQHSSPSSPVIPAPAPSVPTPSAPAVQASPPLSATSSPSGSSPPSPSALPSALSLNALVPSSSTDAYFIRLLSAAGIAPGSHVVGEYLLRFLQAGLASVRMLRQHLRARVGAARRGRIGVIRGDDAALRSALRELGISRPVHAARLAELLGEEVSDIAQVDADESLLVLGALRPPVFSGSWVELLRSLDIEPSEGPGELLLDLVGGEPSDFFELLTRQEQRIVKIEKVFPAVPLHGAVLRDALRVEVSRREMQARLAIKEMTGKRRPKECDLAQYFELVSAGRVAPLERLLQTVEVPIETPDSDGLTALHIAATKGHLALATMLLGRWAPIDAQTPKGWSSLHFAAEKGFTTIVQLFIHKWVLIDPLSTDGYSPLHLACEKGHTEVVQLLLDAGADRLRVTQGTKLTCLHLASQHGHVDVVHILLSWMPPPSSLPCSLPSSSPALWKPADLPPWEPMPIDQASAVDGWASLHFAVANGSIDVVRLLLLKGAKVTVTTDARWTALHLACKANKADMVVLLLSVGASIEAVNVDGWTSLHIAALYGHSAIVLALLDAISATPTVLSATLRAATTKEGWTSLHVACQKGSSDTVRVLLSFGAPIESVSKDGWKSLHLACEYGHAEVVKLLLYSGGEDGGGEGTNAGIAGGAAIESRSAQGWTCLHLAAMNGHANVARVLLDAAAGTRLLAARSPQGWASLHRAAANGHVGVVKLLLDRGAAIEMPSMEGWTSLHLAAMAGHRQVVELLLHRGASVDAYTKEGWTSLHRAAAKGFNEVVRALVDHGADVERPTKEGWTSLHLASEHGHVEVVQTLLNAWALLEGTHPEGWTSLHQAAANDHCGVALLLLDRGAPVDATSNDGWTSLHQAAQQGHLNMVTLLLNRNANVMATSRNGRTALHLASLKGHVNVVKVLLDRGASIEARDEQGHSSLYSAMVNQQGEVVKMLLRAGDDPMAMTQAGWTSADAGGRVANEHILARAMAPLAAPEGTSKDAPVARATLRGDSILSFFRDSKSIFSVS